MPIKTPTFETTPPFRDRDRIPGGRASDSSSDHGEHRAAVGPSEVIASGTRLSALNPSLMQDLQRVDPAIGDATEPAAGIDLLEVMAASLRHARPLRLQVQSGMRVLPMTVWPSRWGLQSPLRPEDLLTLPMQELRLLSVQPALHMEPPAAEGALLTRSGHGAGSLAALSPVDEGDVLSPLRPWLWELALRGPRRTLLPEIAGVATYRIAPGAELRTLEISGSLQDAVQRLHRQTTPLRHIAAFEGFDADRAVRLLNALYLQAALMISRSHPDAIR